MSIIRARAAAAGAALVAASTIAVVAGTTEAADAHAACPHSPGNYSGSFGYDDPVTTGVHIRTGTSTSCTGLGIVYASHDTMWWCSHYDGSKFWNYGKDYSTGKVGWERADYVVRGAISYRCPA